ncbi:aminodeoxychorismate lyase [Pantoea septica]|uniref:aminodeoxychorismate lyase n=1 Tax=Pantoea septica TaxID=472695 RepID=UPI00289E394B|nr:aminodeoxychorismate lyase [Pantoea septica]
MWINGTEQRTLPVSDRATQFGDGCFTTAAVHNGRIQLLAAHLRRLREGCERLMMPDVDWSQLEKEMRAAAQPHAQAVLKVILSAGAGGRGYSRKGGSGATSIVSVAPWPHHYQPLQTLGVRLRTSPVRLAQSPLLAGIKHLNRLEQVMIRAHLDQSDADEALVLDTAGYVVECCAANLFWRQGERVFTPDLTHAGVDGVMRRYLMEQMAAAGLHCDVVRCEATQLQAADEIVICNALMPVLPVRQLDDRTFSERALYQRFQHSCYLMEAK